MVPQGHRLWKVKIRISLTRLLFFTAKLSETKIVMNPLLFSKSLGIGMQHGHNSYSLRWRHNGRDSVSNHQPHHCLLNRYSDADQRKHQSSASLAFVWGIHRGSVNSPHKWPVARKMFPFDDVIMSWLFVMPVVNILEMSLEGPRNHNFSLLSLFVIKTHTKVRNSLLLHVAIVDSK